jgi:hypothetical protein
VTTKTTIHLVLRTRSWLARNNLPIPMVIAAATFLLMAGIAFIGRHIGHSNVAEPPAPIIMIATSGLLPPRTPQPTLAAQMAAAETNVLTRAIVAYSAPNGVVLGAVEQGRPYVVLASYGRDWLQVDITGSGLVWIHTADLLNVPADLTDLQPTEAPHVVIMTAPLAVPTLELAGEQEETAPPTQTPAPTPIAALSDPQSNDPAFAASFSDVDPAARCQFIGCLPGRNP